MKEESFWGTVYLKVFLIVLMSDNLFDRDFVEK